MVNELEYCLKCDEPTGRCGKGDNSLYLNFDTGPFCGECFDEEKAFRELQFSFPVDQAFAVLDAIKIMLGKERTNNQKESENGST